MQVLIMNHFLIMKYCRLARPLHLLIQCRWLGAGEQTRELIHHSGRSRFKEEPKIKLFSVLRPE